MDKLTSEQSQALWNAGGFIIIKDLPEGSEYGIDGTYHLTRRFSGSKLIPPGLHLITISPPTSGPSSLPFRSGCIHYFKPRERLILHYDVQSESLILPNTISEIISDERLKAVDGELAAYPFQGLSTWKGLTRHVDEETLQSVLGGDGRVDGLMGVKGEIHNEDDGTKALFQASNGSKVQAEERKLRFIEFQLKRSWRDGAVGEEVTKYARDKSFLLGKLSAILNPDDNDPIRLLGQLQLAFILFLNLSSYPCLSAYKRILLLFTRSSSYITGPHEEHRAKTYIAFVEGLGVQLGALPDGVFDTELPEMDGWYMDEIEVLRVTFLTAIGVETTWREEEIRGLRLAWDGMRTAARDKWRWDLGTLFLGITKDTMRHNLDDEDDEDEEGEYAPAIVEL